MPQPRGRSYSCSDTRSSIGREQSRSLRSMSTIATPLAPACSPASPLPPTSQKNKLASITLPPAKNLLLYQTQSPEGKSLFGGRQSSAFQFRDIARNFRDKLVLGKPPAQNYVRQNNYKNNVFINSYLKAYSMYPDFIEWMNHTMEHIAATKPRMTNMMQSKTQGSKWCRNLIHHRRCQYGETCHFAHHWAEFKPMPCVQHEQCDNGLCSYVHPRDVSDDPMNIKIQLRQLYKLFKERKTMESRSRPNNSPVIQERFPLGIPSSTSSSMVEQNSPRLRLSPIISTVNTPRCNQIAQRMRHSEKKMRISH